MNERYRLHDRGAYLIIERVSDGKCWITEVDDLDDPRLYVPANSLDSAISVANYNAKMRREKLTTKKI